MKVLARFLTATLSALVALAAVGLSPATVRADATPLTYNNGSVIATPKVYVDFWGPEWNNAFPTAPNGQPVTSSEVKNYITTYFNSVGGSDWMSLLTQYYSQDLLGNKTYITNPASQLAGVWPDTSALPPASQFTKISVRQYAAQTAIPHFNDINDLNAVYFILTGPGQAPNDLESSGPTCAYHDEASYNNHTFAIAYVPYPLTTPVDCSFSGSVANTADSFGHATLDGYSIIIGHEYAEAITDPTFNIVGGPPSFVSVGGWWDHYRCQNGGTWWTSCLDPSTWAFDEIGDKCGGPELNWTPTPNPLFGNVQMGSQYFAAEGLWSNAAGACSLGPYNAPCTSISASASPPSPSLIGTTVIFYAGSSPCPKPLFRFWLLVPGSSTWQSVQGYGTSSQFTWYTGGLTPGTYYIVIGVRDAGSAGITSNGLWRWDASIELTYVLPAPPTGLMIAENSGYTWVAHGTRLEKFDLGGFGPNMFSTTTSGTTGPHAQGYFDMGANITAIAVNESYLYIGLSTGRVIKTTMCGVGYNPCAFADNMGGGTIGINTYWQGYQDYSLGRVTALAVNSSFLYASFGTRTVKTTLCATGPGMCRVNPAGTASVYPGGQFWGYQDWSAPVVAEAANDSYVFTSLWGNGFDRVCKTNIGSSGGDVFALSSGACTGSYPGYSDWYGYQDLSSPAVGLAVDGSHVYWSLGNTPRLIQTNMCGSGGNVCAMSDGYGSGSLSGYHYWVGRQDICSGYQPASVASSLVLSSYVDWAFGTGSGMSRVIQATPGTGGNMFATGDCTGTSSLSGWSYWVGYQNFSI